MRDRIRAETGNDITWARVKAVLKELGVLDNREYYRPELSLGKGSRARQGFRPVVVDRTVEALESGAVDPNEVWEKHGDDVWN